MIFFWPHVSHLGSIRFETVKKIIFLKKLEKFEIVKWSELDFALEKSTKKWFFADFTFLTCAVLWVKTVKKIHFLKKLQKFEIVKLSELESALWKSTKMIFFWPHVSHLGSIRFETVKKIIFLKKLEKFEIVKWSELDFALEKSTKKSLFFWSHVSHLWSIGVETVKKLTFLKKKMKKLWNRKVVWNGMERLALIAFNFCKINAKFNAKYVRPTPKFNAKLCKISVECVDFV